MSAADCRGLPSPSASLVDAAFQAESEQSRRGSTARGAAGRNDLERLVVSKLDETTVPSHAYKFVAALQHAQSCAHPVYLQVAWGAGHAVGANREESRQTLARQLSFLSTALGLEVRTAAVVPGPESPTAR